MKKEQINLLAELLQDSKRSDGEIAKILGVAQSSVSRNRKKLVDDGIIKNFTVIPDFLKIGFELLSIISFKARYAQEDLTKAKKWVANRPEILFTSDVHGMGKNAVMMTIHKNFSEYSNFLIEVMTEAEERISEVESLLISFKGMQVKQFSPEQLAELIKKENSQLDQSINQTAEPNP